MKAFVFNGVGRVGLEDVPLPTLKGEGAIIKVISSAVCATDVKIFKSGHFKIKEGDRRILGHEIFGEIVEVSKCYEEDFPVGTRVFVAPNLGCGKCEYCLMGKYNLCADYDAFGITIDGAFAEYMFVPRKAFEQGNVLKLTAAVPEGVVPLVEPLSTCLYNLSNLGLEPGDRVLVFGAGFMGILNALSARMMGASLVVVIDPNEQRLEVAMELGVNLGINPQKQDLNILKKDLTDGKGFDVVIVSVPVPEAQAQALELVSKLGRVSFFAGLPKGTPFPTLNTNVIHYNQITLTGTTGADVEYYRRALNMVVHREDLREKLIRLVSSFVTLEELPNAFERLAAGKELKVVVLNQQGG